MPYLLDTHTLIWLFENNPQLSDRAKLIIVDENNELFISIASLWEMTIKSSLGKLDLSLPLSELFAQKLIPSDIQILPIQLQHLAILQELPFHHRDPFDRIIIAQAIAENLTLLSTDRTFENYRVTCDW
jgi:PIN domain nuclease of toxin-antitoxin system